MSKLKGVPKPGNPVYIYWEDQEHFDEGYFYALPESDVDEYDIEIHITSTHDHHWINLDQLLQDDLCTHIITKDCYVSLATHQKIEPKQTEDKE